MKIMGFSTTEEQRKLLTEWLGECWHEKEEIEYCEGKNGGKCRIIRNENRTFDNWNDFGAVVEKLRTLPFGKQEATLRYLLRSCVFLWDYTPERFCILVAEAIKAGVIK